MKILQLLVIFIIFSSTLTGCISGDENIEINGIEYNDPPDAPNFSLLNQNRENITLSEYEGRVVVVAFLYTSCPDVCLALSANLDWVHENLGDYSDDVVILSITIDPARDTPERFAAWMEIMGLEWDHLSADQASTLVKVWDEWNIVIDNDHINASEPPEGSTNRVVVMYPDNSTTSIDLPYSEIASSAKQSDFSDLALELENITLDSGTNWQLYAWDLESWNWSVLNESHLDSLFDSRTNLAWIAEGGNLSQMPPGIDCNGRGWVMGEGGGAHCMCDDGYERGEDMLTCVTEGENDASTPIEDPHEQSLSDYGVGHSTVTFILDKELRKRVAWGGTNWDVNLFLADVKTLVDE
jgi:cytochrome oxidase Cu insertion factor (SCO1/SenC/PrrC family)|tara:strand:- start:18 stop:1079 length:1062 start_codon:yes stop_codon:yes gene_type:complete